MPETTQSITTDRESKKKAHSTASSSETIQELSNKLQEDPKITISKNPKSDKRKVNMIAEVAKKQEPDVPKNLPKQAQEMKLRKGKNKIQRYIILKWANTRNYTINS
jgi:hypothetical protein